MSGEIAVGTTNAVNVKAGERIFLSLYLSEETKTSSSTSVHGERHGCLRHKRSRFDCILSEEHIDKLLDVFGERGVGRALYPITRKSSSSASVHCAKK